MLPAEGPADLARAARGASTSATCSGHIPLPAKITIQVLDPIDLREEFGEDPDLDEVYDEILGRMQDALDRARRRAPPPGDRLTCGSRSPIAIDAPARGDLGDRHRPRAVHEVRRLASRAGSPRTRRGPRARRALLDAHAGRLGRGRRAGRGGRVGRVPATWPGPASPASTSAAAGGCASQEDGTTTRHAAARPTRRRAACSA